MGAVVILGGIAATMLAFGWIERVDHEVSGEQLPNAEHARLQPMDPA